MYRCLLLFLFTFFLPFATEAKEKICLNMIVKDESKVIKRCLDSVIPFIDYWVIVDTGSTDGTQEIIKKHLKGIPGELYERPWKNFGESRTEALNLAKGKADYLLFMDADDTLEFEKGFKWPSLTKDLYNMWRGYKGFSYIKPQLVKANLPWKWVGVTHEYLACDQPYTSEVLEKVKYVSGDGGASSHDPMKFKKNVKLLKAALKEDPDNSRNVFYLAESYLCAGSKGKALEWYQKRVDMGGWEEEVYWSMLQIGHLLRDIGLPATVVIESYKLAHQFRPHRPEALYYLADVCIQQKDYNKASSYLRARENIPKPKQKDMLFNMDWIEEYGLLFQQSICSYFLGRYQESLDTCDQLLAIKDMPDSWREQAKINRSFPLEKLQAKN